jgi:restriction endonuclease Mrr
MSQELEQAKEQALAGLEIAVETAINEKLDSVVTELLNAMKVAIPGQLDDLAIETAKPVLLPVLKKTLLQLAEKISEKV